TFNTSAFAFSDSSDLPPTSSFPASTLRNVIVTTPPSSTGTIFLGGSAQLPNIQVTVSPAQIVSNSLKFTPALNTNSSNAPSPTIAFQVQDDGGTLNGGLDTSFPANTITFNVSPVNDPPGGVADSLSSVAEDSGVRTIAFSALLANDSKGPNEDSQTLTIITVRSPVGGTVQ